MDYLRDFFERKEAQEAIGMCRDSRAVQGVAVELDDFWLSSWRAAAQENPLEPPAALGPQQGIRWLMDGGVPVQTAGAAPPATRIAPTGPLRSADLSWAPPGWGERVRPNAGEPENPVQFRIYVYPEYGRDPEATLPQLSELPINYVFESTPVPRLAAAANDEFDPLIGGVSIGINPQEYGTLGGVVQDSKNRSYGVTCAHVVSNGSVVYHPSQRDSANARPIGRVAHSQLPRQYPHGLPITPAHQAANSNDMDVALIEIDVAARLAIDTLGPITGIFPSGDIQQWHPAIFAGRSSDVRSVEFLTPAPYFNIPTADGRDTNCFNNIYLIQWMPGDGSNGKPPVQQGDSGAWLCIAGPRGFEWAGMIIAWSPRMGFAISASRIARWWQQLGFTLSPV
jgi:hypothetical protein